MAYKTKYILAFSNELNEVYEIYFEFMDYLGDPILLYGVEDCMTLRSTTGDENRFEPILGTECLINIHVGPVNVKGIEFQNDTLQIFDLITEHDNDIRVTVYHEQDYTKSIFQGFIVVEDNSQPLSDPPFTLSVRALDGLGLLKGIDFLDTDGNAFAGSMSPIKWIAQILYKTDQKLNIRAYFNILNIDFPALPCIESFTINVSTFQTGQPQTTNDPTIDIAASIADDCYTALEKIVRCLRCRLFQQDGVWNLVNIWEYQNPAGYSYVEYVISDPVDGIVAATPSTQLRNINYDVPVGSDQIIHPVEDDATLGLKLATKSEKLTYTYDQSLNKICNQTLIYGDADTANNGTISSTFQSQSITPPITFSYLAYFAFCFTHLDGPAPFHPYPGVTPTGVSYIRDIQDVNGYSVDRYLMIGKPTGILTYQRSSKFLIDVGDVLNMSFDWRTKENENVPSGSGTAQIAYVFLYGIDGTFWALSYIPQGTNKPQWVQMPDANFVDGAGNTPTINSPQFTDSANNGFMNITTVLQAPSGIYYGTAPVSGDVEVLFLYLRDKLPAVTEYWFKNISISVIPFLNGSFKELKGDFNFASSNNNIKQTDEQDVEISDSPKRYFKGAILQVDGKTLMPNSWIRAGVTETGRRFTQVMEELLYNAFYRQIQMIEGSMRGVTRVDSDYNVKDVGFINRFYFTDHPEPTKKFMLTSFEIDYATGFGRRVFVEILNDQNDTNQVVPDKYLFQYIFQ